jgi:phosphoribosylformylglycinamidine cyclo-ligase
MSLTYKSSGVDLDLYEQAMGRLPRLMNRTMTPRAMPLPGGFAGLFRLQDAQHRYEDPVLVSGTDGVGTKIKVAHMAGVFNTIGIDLVGMCVNDCLCLGAEPLFFLDYIALGRDNPDLIVSVVEGVSTGCVEAGAALLGGETAIMPDVYGLEEFDVAGFCVGVVEKSRILDGSKIRVGDVVVAIPSSGLHSNGYSLVRKAVFGAGGLKVTDHVKDLSQTVGEVLLTPTRIYAKTVGAITQDERLKDDLSAIAHITGGGLCDNISRLLPEGCGLTIDRGTWTPAPVFGWLQGLGKIDREEMFRVFNMGVGMTFVVRPEAVDHLRSILSQQNVESWVCGEITTGQNQEAKYVN